MVTSKTSIGEIVNFIHKHPGSIGDRNLQINIESLIYLIKSSAEIYGVKEASEVLFDKIFELRIEILSNTILVDRFFQEVSDLLEKRIQRQFENKSLNRDLEQSFVNAINIYRQINLSSFENIKPQDFIVVSQDIDYSSIKFSALQSLLGEFSFSKEIPYLLSFLTSSFKLDYAFIASELIFDKDLQIKKSEIKILCQLLKYSIEEYAVSANFLKLWEPEEEDESQWMRNIKIRIAMQEAKESKDFFPISTFKELINP